MHCHLSMEGTLQLLLQPLLYITLLVCLGVCLFVCLKPINVKTAEPIRPKFFEGPRMTQGKVYGCSELQKVVSKSF